MPRGGCTIISNPDMISSLSTQALNIRNDAPEFIQLPRKCHSTPSNNQLGKETLPPPNSFFQASRNVSISGGHFNSTMGHHTNLTIHLGQIPLSNAEPASISLANSTSKGSTEQREVYDTLSGNLRDITPTQGQYGQNGNGTSSAPHSNPRQMPPSIQKSNEVYEKQLSMKGRGFPLWIPEPNRRLPIAYRKEGVSIGDVGIITPSGGFSFLFNICLPADDPVNLGRVPEDFVPIYPSVDAAMDIREFFEFKQGNYLASASIENSKNDAFSPDLFFESTASEGAILTMPEGAISFELENIPHFRTYAAANVESWYRFVNGPRGREAKNGDIRLITGCDKTTSWGMAVLSNISQETRKNCLRFKAVGDPQNPSACSYTWECSGMVEARVGPDRRETDDIRRQERSPGLLENDEKYLNQCLFVRTLNLTLGAEMWENLTQELALKTGSTHITSPKGSFRDTTATGPGNNRNEGSSLTRNGAPPSDSVGSQHQISMTATPEISSFHPSKYLNGLLLERFPAAKMIVTHDEDWTFVAVNGGFAISAQHKQESLTRIMDKYDVVFDESGALFLDVKKETLTPSFDNYSPEEEISLFRGLEELSLYLTHSDDIEGSDCGSSIFSNMVIPDRRRHSISEYALGPPVLSSDFSYGVDHERLHGSSDIDRAQPSRRTAAFADMASLDMSENNQADPGKQLSYIPFAQASLSDLTAPGTQPPKNPGTFVCSIPSCHASFFRKLGLESHMKTHLQTSGAPVPPWKEGKPKAYAPPPSLHCPREPRFYPLHDKKRPATTDGNLSRLKSPRSRGSLLPDFQVWARAASTCSAAVDPMSSPRYDPTPYTSI